MKSNTLKCVLFVLAMLISAACAAGVFEVTLSNAKKMTLVVHNDVTPSWVRKPFLNYAVIGDVNPRQLAIATEVERVCRIYVKTVRAPSDGQTRVFETCAQEIFDSLGDTKGKVHVLRETFF